MNRILLGIAALAATVCIVVSCKKDDPDTTPQNQAPSLTILKPEDGISYGIDGADTTFAIEAVATDPDGSISKVEFFIDGSKIGEDVTQPYSYTYTFLPNTAYTIKGVATDNLGATTTREFVEVVAIPN